jgi:hypothetical protein
MTLYLYVAAVQTVWVDQKPAFFFVSSQAIYSLQVVSAVLVFGV